VAPLKIGNVVSIHVTVANTSQVFPYASVKVKLNVSFPVNVYQVKLLLLVTVTPVLLKVMDAITFPLVRQVTS